MSRTLSYEITADELPCTLGKYLRRRGYSAALLTALRQQDAARVNGGPRRMIDPLAADELVEVRLPEQPSALAANSRLALSVLYEDEDLLALDKPDDMLVHPAGPGCDDAVGNFFAAHYPGRCFRPLGRLDRHTTGVCLIAKNWLAAAALGEVEKTYFALAEGEFAMDSGLIDAPIAEVAGTRIVRCVAPGGKPSRTRFCVLRRLDGLTFLRLTLLTGRTHQIRVHVQHIGHPLAGDTLYGGSTALIGRQALHCGQLSFCHPISGALLSISSPLPRDMAALLDSSAAGMAAQK